MSDRITLHIDGSDRTVAVPPAMTLVQLLKREGYRGLRQACDGGSCGGCTVLLDQRPVLSCLLNARQSVGRKILTIEGVIAYNDELRLLPLCLKKAGSAQCGFCTCGFIMAAAGLYFAARDPQRDELVTALSGNLCRCTGYEKIIRGVELFFAVINGRTDRAQLASAHDCTAPVGERIEKLDGDGLTRGEAAYASDMVMPRQLVMRLLTATVAHARIRAIDISAAEKLPGVRLVLTHRNTPDTRFTTAAQGYPEPSPYDARILTDTVRFHGEPVAAVVAEDLATADAALQLITVDYDELPVMLTFADAYEQTKAAIHPAGLANFADPAHNLVCEFQYTQGAVGQTPDLVRVSGTFTTSKQQHVHLEPHVAIAAKDEYGRINIISSTQVPFDVRRIVARALGLPFSMVRVSKPRLGGGFGGKQEVLVETIVACAAARLDRPVKLLLSRREEFLFARTRHPFRVTLELGFTRAGKLTDLTAGILSDTGAYGGHGSTVAELATMRIASLYPAPNVRVDTKVICTNKTPGGAFRGYGEPQVMFALESLMDEAAAQLGMDPAELRLLNHIRAGDRLPVETLFVQPHPPGEVITTCELPRCIARGQERIGWGTPRPAPAPHVRTGKGMAISLQGSGIANITRSSVTVSLNEDGSIQLLSGAVDVGTGADTVLAQIAAQTLGVPLTRIHIITADTAVTPYDSGSYASNTTYFAGHAVQQACARLREQIFTWAAAKFQLPRDGMALRGNMLVAGDITKPLPEVATAIFADLRPVDTVFCITVKKETAAPPFIATFVDVDVDIQTGRITVVKAVQVADCGTIINPLLAEGQMEGATLQALGYALTEEISYAADGRVRESDLLAYRVPTIFEKPEFAVEFIQPHEPTGPYGAKAVGEVAFATMAPAINNAVFAACGVRFRDLPMSPERFFAAQRS
ncbi:MAG TPA: molybdopterin-dependent oxidoreductase [bacterium]|nr:molybdopterin-dependent oxidoreductase [bacterium]